MSWPAQNAGPAPVRIRISVSSSIARSSSTSSMSMCSCGDIALRLSGRLKITQVIPLSFSTLMVSYFLAAIALTPRVLDPVSDGGIVVTMGRECPGGFLLRHLSRQGDSPFGGKQQQHLAIGRQRQVGSGGHLQVDAVAHHVDAARRAQKSDPADAAGEA